MIFITLKYFIEVIDHNLIEVIFIFIVIFYAYLEKLVLIGIFERLIFRLRCGCVFRVRIFGDGVIGCFVIVVLCRIIGLILLLVVICGLSSHHDLYVYLYQHKSTMDNTLRTYTFTPAIKTKI